jgi:hypothetical protein
MEPGDVAECVEIIEQHPVIGPRYGNRIGDLGKAWQRLFGCEGARGYVFHVAEGPRAPICVVGFSIFVNDIFMRELKAPPGFWLGPELAKRILRGDSPVLSDRQVREGNSRGGLNLIVWEGCIRSGYETNTEIPGYIMSAFIEVHRGFLLKELVSPQIESEARLQWTVQTGGGLWNPVRGCYEQSFKKHLKEVVSKPHIVGATRMMDDQRPASWSTSWVGTLFDYHPPRCGFSPKEQRMLLLAQTGATDQELSQKLQVALPTVKKMWLSAYRRVNDHLPELNQNQNMLDATTTGRGKEKKRRLLVYLRTHPEELRPTSQKLL